MYQSEHQKGVKLTAKRLGVAGVQEHLDGLVSGKPFPLVRLETHGGTQGPVRAASPGALARREVVVGIADESVEWTI